MRRKSWHWIAVLLVGVVGTGLVTGYWMKKHRKPAHVGPAPVAQKTDPAKISPLTPPAEALPDKPPPPPTSDSAPASAPSSLPASSPASQLSTAPADPPAAPKLDAAGAAAAFKKGLGLLKHGHLIDARTQLSAALLSEHLSAHQEKEAQAELEKLAQKTIFSDEVVEGDPYAYYYTVRPGDKLGPLERRERLRVPGQLILKVNGLSQPTDIRSGSRIKLVRGPFHAIISKSRFTVDIVLQREDLPPVWVTQVRCGLGNEKQTPTPLGAWRVGMDSGGTVVAGGKLIHPPWTPTDGSGIAGNGPILYGKPGYALGEKGLWIGLVGIDDRTRGKSHYGIHSTSDPDSIGKEQSLGCIRLADEDIELVYSLLYEVHSTVQIRP
jgi:hypothetical protein